jgi:hypothetical protein
MRKGGRKASYFVGPTHKGIHGPLDLNPHKQTLVTELREMTLGTWVGNALGGES